MPFKASQCHLHVTRYVHQSTSRAVKVLEQPLRSPNGLPSSVSLCVWVGGRPAKETQLANLANPRDLHVILTFQYTVLNHLAAAD